MSLLSLELHPSLGRLLFALVQLWELRQCTECWVFISIIFTVYLYNINLLISSQINLMTIACLNSHAPLRKVRSCFAQPS
ncbi:hypothetical protein GLYMA_17G104900v4 [Glycine max]|uniref:Uncharacterized protein n=1 Tax=Glycine max TaxID=3847 RepID=A0A0R0FJS9_SOYBN|nr:hypothetical protein GYH30_046877 [Glycine max]KRH03555.1 hypothetical protein GLYMA_17G104900v4 [Glycine max]